MFIRVNIKSFVCFCANSYPRNTYTDFSSGYLSDSGSTLSQMESVEVPAKPEWRCRAAGECTIDNEQCTMGGEVGLEVGRWWSMGGGIDLLMR